MLPPGRDRKSFWLLGHIVPARRTSTIIGPTETVISTDYVQHDSIALIIVSV